MGMNGGETVEEQWWWRGMLSFKLELEQKSGNGMVKRHDGE